MSVDSNSLFASREDILAELRSIEEADRDRLNVSLADLISDAIDPAKSVGSLTGNAYLDSIGLTSGTPLDIIFPRSRLADFPPEMPLKNLLLLKDSSGNFIDPNSISSFEKFWEGYVRDDNNYAKKDIFNKAGDLVCEEGDFKDGFFRGINLGQPGSMSEISLRLINVLDDGLRHNGRTLDSYKKYSNDGWTLSDLVAHEKKHGMTPEAFNSAMDCIAYPGLYERTRSIYISALNHRLNEFFEARAQSGDFNVSYSDLRRVANSCQKYAVVKAKESIDMDRIKQGIHKHFDNLARKFLDDEQALKRKIENGQKTHTQYGKTIRLDPKKPLLDQLKKAQENYVPWVGKKLDSLVSKGLVEVAASAIAKRNGRDYVSSADVDAALGAIASARKNVGEFDSIKGFVKRLAGPGNENFANAAAGYLQANAEKRQTMLASVSGLATKLATYERGQIPGVEGEAAKRVRVNGEDRKVGHAVAATALLRANGGVPNLRQVNEALSAYNLSVKAAQEQASKIRTLDKGLAVRLGRDEQRMPERQKIQIDIAARHHVMAGEVGGEVVLKQKRSADKTSADIKAALNPHVTPAQTVEPEAPKPIKSPDEKGPKI